MSDTTDRGGVTIFVVLMMPLLIFFGAFVFDGGRGIVARRETQNAADAGALAKATDCAKKLNTTDFGPYQTDGAVLANTPSCGTDSTTVTMKKTIDLAFSPGGGSRDVSRSATAKWGTMSGATTIPITIARCEFPAQLDTVINDLYIYLDDPKPQSGCSSLPGGFSGLLDDDCAVKITAGGFAKGWTGVAEAMKAIPCITNPTGPALPRQVLIPMYDSAACADTCKGKGPYPIVGFASFVVTGYSFNGQNFAGDGMGKKCPDEKDRGKYCLRGDFIQTVSSQGTVGPSTNFGTTLVYLFS